jgi:hypothetical protein
VEFGQTRLIAAVRRGQRAAGELCHLFEGQPAPQAGDDHFPLFERQVR